MAVYLSPGVFPREIDLSVLPAAVGPLRPAFVGTAQRGPLNTPTYITTAQQALDTFGEPFVESYLMYAVLAYLEEGNQCYVVRVGVEYEEGLDEALSSVAISADGSKEFGWGRLGLFTGIDYGRINLRPVTAENPLVFHNAYVTSETGLNQADYKDAVFSLTDGATDAELNISGTFTGAEEDSYLLVITGAPTSVTPGLQIEGATYSIYNKAGLVTEGTFTELTASGISGQFTIGAGLTGVVTLNSGVLDVNDTFTFYAYPNNRRFTISVEGVNSHEYTIPTPIAATATTPSTAKFETVAGFVTVLSALVKDNSFVADFDFVVNQILIGDVLTEIPSLVTDQGGQWIQVVGTAGFALEVGTQQYAYDIPRAHLLATDNGPYNITNANNRVKINVVGKIATTSVTFNVPLGSGVNAVPTDSLVAAINAAGVVPGGTVFNALKLTAPGGREYTLILTTVDNDQDALVMLANYSNVKTLKFAQTLGIAYPYEGHFRGFIDVRTSLPPGSSTDAGVPADNADADYYANIVGYFVATSPGTWVDQYKLDVSLFTSAVGDSANRYVVSVIDKNGIAVEVFRDVVFDKTADNYVGNYLNPGTKYGGTQGAKTINWEERPAYIRNDPTMTDYEVRNPSTLNKAPFAGQQNGIPIDPAYSGAVDAAVIGNAAQASGLYGLQNKETYDINLLLTPGFSSGAVIATGLSICEARGDVLYIIDPPFGLRPQQVVDWHNGMLFSDLASAINSSYGALYWGWVKYYDQFNVNEVYIPPSGHVAAVFSRTSRTTEQWFAPAGLTRGRVLTALEVEYTPTQGENELLYGSGNSVNPLIKFPQDGIVVWGQRTLQRVDTSLSRVNVRMLLIYIKKVLTQTLRSFIFEPNDKALWDQVVTTVNPFLGDIQSRRGLTAFKVVCDASNNTPERIDRNELWVSVFIKPTRAVEFIVLNIAVINTGANFSSEAVLAAGGVSTAAGA